MPHPIQTKLARNRAKLLDVIANLSEEQCDLRTPTAWTIRETLTHLLNGEEDNARVIAVIVKGEAHRLPTDFDLDAHNARRVEERPTMTLAELIDALAVQRQRTEALLNKLSEDQLALTGPHPLAGESSAKDIFRFIVLHDPIHTRDIRAALEKTGGT